MMDVFFDNSATTSTDPEVMHSMREVMLKYDGNSSSLHKIGLRAEKMMTKSKTEIGKYLNVSADEVLFTSGGTESNNLALKGVAFGYQQRGRHIITSQVEHSSVYEACLALERDFNFEVTYLPVDVSGRVNPEDVQNAIRKDTILVSIMHVNNEIGTIQPIQEIGQIVAQYPKILFHVDDVQGIGKVPLAIRGSHIDLLSIAGHKIHAPKGTGCLIVKKGVQLYPLFHGGLQQEGTRPGTENVAGAVALAKAVRLIKSDEARHISHLCQLKQRLIDHLHQLEHVHIHSALDSDLFAPHIVNVSFMGVKAEVFLHALEEKGIYVSTRSACSSRANEPSRVLQQMGLNHEQMDTAIRISFSIHNTLEEVDYFYEVVWEMYPYYRQLMNK